MRALIICGALLLVACGSDDDGNPSFDEDAVREVIERQHPNAVDDFKDNYLGATRSVCADGAQAIADMLDSQGPNPSGNLAEHNERIEAGCPEVYAEALDQAGG